MATKGANVAAINYYFKGKKGLYVEILLHIVELVREQFRDVFPEYMLLKATMPNPKRSREMLKKCIRRFVELICSDKFSVDLGLIYIHEYMQASPYFETLSKGLNEIYFPWCVALLQDASEGALSEKEANLQTVMMFSEIFSVLTRKEVILKVMGWQDYTEEAINEILSIIYRNIGIK